MAVAGVAHGVLDGSRIFMVRRGARPYGPRLLTCLAGQRIWTWPTVFQEVPVQSFRSRVAVACTSFLMLLPLLVSDVAGQDGSTLTAEALVEILSADERLDALSADDRAGALHEAANWGSYCESNVTLGAHYDCACFARAMLDFRFEDGFEVIEGGNPRRPSRTWTDLSGHVTRPLPECISPDKLAAYTTRTLPQLVIGGEPEEIAKLTPCVVDAVVARYQTEFGTPSLRGASPDLLLRAISEARMECEGGTPSRGDPGDSG